MAKTPWELMEKYNEGAEQEASRLEALIDAAMERNFRGGTFTYAADKMPSQETQDILRSRYSCWSLTFYNNSTMKDPDNFLIVFQPLPPGGSSTPRRRRFAL